METIEYRPDLLKDSKVIHISTQTTSCIPLNGSKKSKVMYTGLSSYLDFQNDESIEYVTLQMPYAVMSNSNLIVNSNNNILKMTINAVNYEYIIPLGNYTAQSLKTTLLALFPSGFTMNYSSISNKFTLTYSAAFSMNVGSTCDYIIGFTGTETAALVGSIYSLTCSRSYNFLPIARFIIHCNILSDGVILGENSTLLSNDILASIPNNSKPNGQIVYENIASEFLIKSYDFTNIMITITDDNNREIDFLGISSYFQLKFNIFRRTIKRPMRFNHLVEYATRISADQQNDEEQ